MIDSLFQSGTDTALDDQVQRSAPFKPPEVKFGVGQLVKAPFQGIASGSTKTAAFAADVLGAFGDVAGSGGFNAGGMFATATPEERKQQEAARQRWVNSGPEFSNPVGDELRQRAKDVMPDPTQTHAAAQIVAGISEFATQAVTYAAAAGPLAPALLAGDVGMAEADKLKQEGVGLGARTAAGAVAGVAAGASVALPVVGTGIKSTAALVAAGGPGMFISQNVAERAILENAGYSKIASQYDPLDPVGLALSTLVPAAFGGVALRARMKAPATLKEVVLGIESNNTRYGKDGKILEGPMTRLGTAKGEMQVVDSTNLDPGFGVRPAADNSPAERARVGSDYLDAMLKRYGSEDKAMAAYNAGPGAVDVALKKGGDWLTHLPAETQAYVDKGMKQLGAGRTGEAARATIARDPEAVAAARVRQTADHLDSLRLTPDNDLAGMTRHQDAIELAHEQMARGEAVSVTDLLRLDDVRTGRLLDDQIATAETARAALLGDAGNRADPGAVRALREDLTALQAARPDDSPAAVKVRAKELQDSDRLSYKQATAAAQKEVNGRLAEHTAQIDRLNKQIEQNARAQQAGDSVAALDRQIETMRAQRGTLDAPASSPRMLAMALAEAYKPPPVRRAPRVNAVAAEPARATGAEMLAAAGERPAAPAAPAPRAPQDAGVAPRTEVTSPEAAALDAQSAEIDPNLMVQLEGMEKPMSVADLLEQVKKDADEMKQDASFVEVAANCFLRNN